MIFAPLFDLILADARRLARSAPAPGLLNAVQQFCGALGVAVLGSAFFHWLPDHGFVTAIRWLTLLSVACFAVAFLVVFVLPRRAREDAAH